MLPSCGFRMNKTLCNLIKVISLICAYLLVTKVYQSTEYGADFEIVKPTRPVGISCPGIIAGEEGELKRALGYTLNHKPLRRSDQYYIHATSDCDKFKTVMGYPIKPLSDEEAEFPIAFGILMYKEVEQTERLLRAIYRPQNVYCIHVDAKAQYGVRQGVKAIADCFPNVFLASKEVNVVYGSFNRLQADINCMEETLKRHKHWKYFINLASQSFPIKTIQEIVNILKIYNGANDIESLVGQLLEDQKYRFEWKWHLRRQFFGSYYFDKTAIRKDPAPHNLSIVRGSAYGVFSHSFVDYVLSDPVARDLLDWSRDTYSPDEHYWASLNQLHENPQLPSPGGFKGKITFQSNHISIFSDVQNSSTLKGANTVFLLFH